MVRNHKIIMTNYKDNEVIEFQKKRYHLDKKSIQTEGEGPVFATRIL